jgi:hypothetical protein
MPPLDRTTATVVSPTLPTFATANAYPVSRIRQEISFAIAKRIGEIEAVEAPSILNWINDAYTQILGMIENPRTPFSAEVTLPAMVSTIALPASVDQVFSINSLVSYGGSVLITPIHKSVDIEYWRSLQLTEDADWPLLNYYLHQDSVGLLLQFHPQSVPVRLLIDGTVKPPRLVADTDCPVLKDDLCLGLIELAISIALRRFGEFTYAGTQNNAALAIIRSALDEKGQSRKGTVAAISRPRTQEEARRILTDRGTERPYGT